MARKPEKGGKFRNVFLVDHINLGISTDKERLINSVEHKHAAPAPVRLDIERVGTKINGSYYTADYIVEAETDLELLEVNTVAKKQ